MLPSFHGVIETESAGPLYMPHQSAVNQGDLFLAPGPQFQLKSDPRASQFRYQQSVGQHFPVEDKNHPVHKLLVVQQPLQEHLAGWLFQQALAELQDRALLGIHFSHPGPSWFLPVYFILMPPFAFPELDPSS